MKAKDHYDRHLAAIYAWLAGDFNAGKLAFSEWIRASGVPGGENGVALDLGCGHGMQTMALAEHGYRVKALDFSERLLLQLREKVRGLDVQAVNADIRDFQNYCTGPVQLICCWGDTLTHLESQREVEDLFTRAAGLLGPGGCLLLSFRDYTKELKHEARFIPVKSDERRFLTCFLEYFPMFVRVSDVIHERTDDSWQMKVSSYMKLRLDPADVKEMLEEQELEVQLCAVENGVCKVIAKKRAG